MDEFGTIEPEIMSLALQIAANTMIANIPELNKKNKHTVIDMLLTDAYKVSTPKLIITIGETGKD